MKRIIIKKPIDKIKDYIKSVKWQFAKTYAKTAPHEYTVREWNPDKEKQFIEFVKYIRANGYNEIFWGKGYTCYNIDGWKYWTMGDPVNETTVINRAKMIGEQKVKE